MSKELEYEINNFANLLHKDCMNLMEALKKQDKDNKAILYIGRHFKKVILPYEEYQKMCNRLEAIDNANPSEALECVEDLIFNFSVDEYVDRYDNNLQVIKQALLKAQEQEKVLEIIKEKHVNVGLVKTLGSVEQYNQTYVYDNMLNVNWCLTEEEFDLLKEVLENE